MRFPLWVPIAVAVGLSVPSLEYENPGETRYFMESVSRGEVTATVRVMGRLEPRTQVDVSSEVSGIIHRVNVNVNQRVKKGDVLAVLDTTRLMGRLRYAESSLSLARARAAQAEADAQEARALHERLQRARSLSLGRLPSNQDLHNAETAVVRAVSNIAAMRAGIAESLAKVDAVRTDIAKTEIRSPMDGVVLVRAAEPGQIVAASLHAPVLFVLAGDLRSMDLRVAIDEADLPAVEVGQVATFTVAAYPDLAFRARIRLIHPAPLTFGARSPLHAESGLSTAGNVVTYQAALNVDNSDGLLRPGMTASAQISTSIVNDAILVPNDALKFTPSDAVLPRESVGGGMASILAPYRTSPWKCPQENGQALGCVWTVNSGRPALVLFKRGATDQNMTEVNYLESLPTWLSLRHVRNDPIIRDAVRRRLEPGTAVIVAERGSLYGSRLSD